MLLVKARWDLDRRLQERYDFKPKDSAKLYEELADSGAECVVWYCNNANSHSPYHVQDYFDWLRVNRPDSRQRVAMLEYGINGLARVARKTFKASFEEYHEIFDEYGKKDKAAWDSVPF